MSAQVVADGSGGNLVTAARAMSGARASDAETLHGSRGERLISTCAATAPSAVPACMVQR